MIKFKYILGIEGYEQSKEFRHEILHDEMGLCEQKDEYDSVATHFVGRENDIIMCYGRLYPIDKYIYSIDKVCINKNDRGQYVGDTILRALEDRAVSQVGIFIYVTCTKDSEEFFACEGYFKTGEEFEENGTVFIKMKKDLTKVRGCKGGCHK